MRPQVASGHPPNGFPKRYATRREKAAFPSHTKAYGGYRNELFLFGMFRAYWRLSLRLYTLRRFLTNSPVSAHPFSGPSFASPYHDDGAHRVDSFAECATK